PESKYFSPGPHSEAVPPPPAPEKAVGAEAQTAEDTAEDIVVLPGESLAKSGGEAGGAGVPACLPEPPEPTAASEPAEAAPTPESAEITEAPEIAEPAEIAKPVEAAEVPES